MRKMAFEANDDYKQRLADWVEAERVKAGSYRRLAIKMALDTKDENGIGHDTLRIWAKKIFTDYLSDEMISNLASYRKESEEQTKAWLEGVSVDTIAQPQRITQQQIQELKSLEEITNVMAWLIDRQKQIVRDKD
jgi:hypothetical protein